MAVDQVTPAGGADFHRRGGRKGGAETLKRHGIEHFSRIGKAGGATTRKRYGVEHFRKAGTKGAQRMRELLARGRAAEEQGE